MIKIIKRLFCKHKYKLFDKTFINDTDFTGSYYEVLKCHKCDKLSLGKNLTRRKYER